MTTIFGACNHKTFDCPVGVWVIEQRAIMLSATVRSPTVIMPCRFYQQIQSRRYAIGVGGY